MLTDTKLYYMNIKFNLMFYISNCELLNENPALTSTNTMNGQGK